MGFGMYGFSNPSMSGSSSSDIDSSDIVGLGIITPESCDSQISDSQVSDPQISNSHVSNSQASNSQVGIVPDRHTKPNVLDVSTEPYFWDYGSIPNEIRDTRGFRNPSKVLCYRNAAFVLLLHTFDLVYCAKEHMCDDSNCLLCELHEFAREYWYGNDSQDDLEQATQKIWEKVLQVWEVDITVQQDVPEFLTCVLKALCRRCRERLNFMFKNYIRKTYICPSCGELGNRIRGEKDVIRRGAFPEVDDKDNRQNFPVTLPGAIENYMQDIHLETRCEKCNECIVIRESFEYAPEVLLVQMNRVVYVDYNSIKIDKPVHITESMSLPETLYDDETANLSGPPVYELYAVVYHHGEDTHQGHYTIAVKGRDDQWRLVNDHRVSDKSFEEISQGQKAKDAYVLAYRRVYPQPKFAEEQRAWLQGTAELEGMEFRQKINHLIKLPDEFIQLPPGKRELTVELDVELIIEASKKIFRGVGIVELGYSTPVQAPDDEDESLDEGPDGHPRKGGKYLKKDPKPLKKRSKLLKNRLKKRLGNAAKPKGVTKRRKKPLPQLQLPESGRPQTRKVAGGKGPFYSLPY